jgi:hypothetical protein
MRIFLKKLEKFDLNNKTRILPPFAVGCVLVFLLSFWLSASTTFTLLTMVGGVAGFFYSKHSQELQIFRDLFREFNSRYDVLNERLNEIKDRPEGEPLKHEKVNNKSDIDVLYDYFNLCAEEYMYETAGYIDARVWDAWQSGMSYFASDPEIRALWKHESETQKKSYYNFPLEILCNAKP